MPLQGLILISRLASDEYLIMATLNTGSEKNGPLNSLYSRIREVWVPIGNKIILSYLLIIILISGVFIYTGIHIIDNYINSTAVAEVRQDISVAREIYSNTLLDISQAVRSTVDMGNLSQAVLNNDMTLVSDELIGIKLRENLDVFSVMDETGNLLFRTGDFVQVDNFFDSEIISLVLNKKTIVASTIRVDADKLLTNSPSSTEPSNISLADHPESLLMMAASAPIFDEQENIIGVILGGVILNQNLNFVNEINQSIFQNARYKGNDVGIVTIFMKNMGSASCLPCAGSSGSGNNQLPEPIYTHVIDGGQRWVGRQFIENDWYFAAYEPIKGLNYEPVGILRVGIIEQKFVDSKRQMVNAFVSITVFVAIVTIIVSYIISRQIVFPINSFANAAKQIAQENFDVRVEYELNDELGELADTINYLAETLKERDEKIKEFTKSRIMASERLALVGQLSANVAHELNNPLTGIVTYAHLLLEKIPSEHPSIDHINKIVVQADRCKEIIRGLLDFSRQRQPNKTLCDTNAILQNCISLVENQALFHNITVKKDFSTDLPMAVLDPSQMERVFINLIINAAEAMDGNGCLTMATRLNQSSQSIEIDFIDSGHGIEEENITKIFDPFFTTKEVGHGTGLGLAISFGIVKKHQGNITVRSVLGKGSTFRVHLPIKVAERV